VSPTAEQLAFVLKEVSPFLAWVYEESHGESFNPVNAHAYHKQNAEITVAGIKWLCQHLAEKRLIKCGVYHPDVPIVGGDSHGIALTTKGLRKAERAFRAAHLRGKSKEAQSDSAGVKTPSDDPAAATLAGIEAAGLEADPISVAIAMKANNTGLSVRAAAKAVGIHFLKLHRDERWQMVCNHLKQVGKGVPPRKQDDIDPEDDAE